MKAGQAIGDGLNELAPGVSNWGRISSLPSLAKHSQHSWVLFIFFVSRQRASGGLVGEGWSGGRGWRFAGWFRDVLGVR